MEDRMTTSHHEKATFGAGCFWCVEAAFQHVPGVLSVVSGYAGGTAPNPTYEQVCSGTTGHTEVVHITFDSKVISYSELLDIFWEIHDPTTPNRQGNDIGPQYRSIILYHSDEQKRLAEQKKRELSDSGIWKKPVITEIVPFTAFYKAEDYHQNYFKNNPQQPYCVFVIRPKLEKLKSHLKGRVQQK